MKTIDPQAVLNLKKPLEKAVHDAKAEKALSHPKSDDSYRHEPFGWARVALEEGEPIRA